MKFKLIILSFWLVLRQTQADDPLHLTIQLTNNVYYLGGSIPVEITYKNTGAWPISFPKASDSKADEDFRGVYNRGLFKLERIKMPQDKGYEMCEASGPLPLVEFERDITLKPNEECKIKTDLKGLVEFWQLTPGIHQLKLIYHRGIFIDEKGNPHYAKNEKGKENWPSEPFNLTLLSPRTIQAYAKTKEDVLKLTVYPTNVTAYIGEMIPIGLTFKNISSNRIKFTKAFQLLSRDDYFYLERFSTPQDKGDEIVYSPKLSEVFSFIMNRELNQALLPQEEYSTTIDLQKWVKLCHLKSGTHHLVLVFKYPVTSYETGNKEGEHVEGKHGRDAIWPSEPFTLTLKSSR